MKQLAILLVIMATAWAQESSQTTPPTAKAAPTKKSTTAAKKSPSGATAAKSGAQAAKPAVKYDPNIDHPTVAEVQALTANPEVVFSTSMGQMKCELFPKYAPKTVANFIGLAEGTKSWTDPKTGQKVKKPLFNGTIFHRVIPNFMIQGGDPLGNGTGDGGFRFEDEFSPELRFDRPGRLAMANSGPGTNGTQFFITEVPTPHLNGCMDEGGCERGGRHVEKGYGHTIFGQCDDASVELVKQIARVAADPRNNKPDLDVTLDKVTILGGPKKPAVAKKPTVTKRTIPKKAPATPATAK